VLTANTNSLEDLYGGNDGAVGAFTNSVTISACQVATTTTTTTTVKGTTTTTAKKATVSPAVQATPKFTG
jgi:hypothetical protein